MCIQEYQEYVFYLQLQPIYEILSRTDIINIETKRKNLKRALDEYLTEFNACRCSPCQNNGKPMLIKSSCICACQGSACENMRPAGELTKPNKSFTLT